MHIFTLMTRACFYYISKEHIDFVRGASISEFTVYILKVFVIKMIL